MDILWYILYFIGMNGFLVFVIAFMFPIFMSIFVPKFRKHTVLSYPAILLVAFLNIFFGTEVAVLLVHAVGEKGTATVTGTYSTSTQYNNHDVIGYNVLLKTTDGKVVETNFEDDDFNVYPPKNEVTYPDVDDVFNVYYLPGFPKDFIIVDNDDSPWATALRCGDMKDGLLEANSKYEFDRNNPGYRTAYIGAIKKLIAAKCVTDADDLDDFQQDIKNIEAGQP
jgi:hypothetical protein